ncbi:MAG: hypothetical protein QF578_24470 [Alphaproteobacteria bacterium]|jgi:predicted PurR-regulated permease PerM|nr:hypothetical protein [Alphaproteobacteria bacterium]MDP6568002.1 hypothetical protein [Alphaproteobacteria bacterium]MDP6814381.1 hypothetical protein [Alphaproteobacteria bacterium]
MRFPSLNGHWPLVLAAAVALGLWWLGPIGLAIFWPLVLAALFAVCFWVLSRRCRGEG